MPLQDFNWQRQNKDAKGHFWWLYNLQNSWICATYQMLRECERVEKKWFLLFSRVPESAMLCLANVGGSSDGIK